MAEEKAQCAAQENQTVERPDVTAMEAAEQRAAARRELEERMAEIRRRAQESQEAVAEGKGRLELETPFKVGDTEITELVYDFTAITGLEYTDAMDSDQNAMNSYRITNRQALALFAKAAAKQTERVDMRDIVENLGVTDAVEGVQLATLFFNASMRAGRMRISKKSS